MSAAATLLVLAVLTPLRADDSVAAVRVLYQDQEGGAEPYPTRIIVTARHLRIDNDSGSGGFILLDRAAETIYSVNDELRSIVVVRKFAHAFEPPMELRFDQKLVVDDDAPRIAGKPVEHRYYSVNGRRCYDVVSVPGLLEQVAAALTEYREVLASEHARVLPGVPADLHEDCDLAHNVFAPARHLAHGLPVQEWGLEGFRRALLDYDATFMAEPRLFELPEEYARMVVGSGG